jgi:hypothetical protein
VRLQRESKDCETGKDRVNGAQPAKERSAGGRMLLRRRLDWLGGLLLVLLVFVFAAAEDLLEDVLLLFLLGLLRCVGSIAVRRRVGGLADDGGAGCRLWDCRFGGRRFVAADAEDLLDKVLRILPHLAAGVDGRSAIEERGVDVVVGTRGIGEEVRGLVDAGGGDALRRGEGLDVGILREQDRALHELGPYGSRGVSAFDLDVGVIVVADPDDADKVRGIAGEPGIMAGSCLAGGRSGEAVPANRSRS